jgi:hypothetical protein
MRLRRCELLAAVAVVLTVGFSCFGQNSLGPATLENLLQPDAAQDGTATLAPDANEPKSTRPTGTVTRPKDGVEHPDLEKAWATYDAKVKKAAEAIRAAITKQVEAASDKGDLAGVEKLQAISEKFDKDGEVPSQPDLKAGVRAPVADYKKAKDELASAYKDVVARLTMEKKIPLAKAVRDEWDLIKGDGEGTAPTAQRVFLSDLEARNVVVGHGAFGTNGNLGFLGRRITVQGAVSPKGISMHPPTNGASRAVYQIPKGCTHFQAKVAIDDSAAIQQTPVTFKVFGDNRPKPLWESKPPLRGAGQSQECDIEIKGIRILTLIVECPGPLANAHAVWCDPRLLLK